MFYYNQITINKQTIISGPNTRKLNITEKDDSISISSAINDSLGTTEQFSISKNKSTGLESYSYTSPKVKPITIDISYIKDNNEYLEGTIFFNSTSKNKYVVEFQNKIFKLSFINKKGEKVLISTVSYDEKISEAKFHSIIEDAIAQILTLNIKTGNPYFPITDHPLLLIKNSQQQVFTSLEAIIQSDDTSQPFDDTCKEYLANTLTFFESYKESLALTREQKTTEE